MSHTPGPWSYEEPDMVGLSHLGAANGDAVATFLRDPWNSSDIPLIAAVPELFEACALAMDVMNNEDATGLDLYECRLILTRACAKTMGIPALEFVEQELAFIERERAKMGGRSA